MFFPTPIGSTKEGDYDRIWDINFKGTYFMINALAPAMRKRRSCNIINLASAAGLIGMSTYSVYCANKAAIIMLTRALCAELGPDGIRVNCIAPGNTATPMNLNIRTSRIQGFPRYDARPHAEPTTYSEAADMANTAVFLASEESRALHGTTIIADEGLTAGL